MAVSYSVFLVEDEAIIRMMIAGMLEELGHTVAAEAGRIGPAIELATSSEFDLAILDMNLGGNMSFPVAEIIRARDLPLIFASGYGSLTVPEEYRGYPLLQKPFTVSQLERQISITLTEHRAGR
jgi:CheY-like chemotaxis protein